MKPGPWEELQLFDTPTVEPDTYIGQAKALFELWRNTYHGGRGRPVTYSGVRERRLIKGIKEFGYEECKAAILGMQYSDWHMGKNKAGQKYVEIRVALRNEDSIIRFGDLYREHQGKEVWAEPERWQA